MKGKEYLRDLKGRLEMHFEIYFEIYFGISFEKSEINFFTENNQHCAKSNVLNKTGCSSTTMSTPYNWNIYLLVVWHIFAIWNEWHIISSEGLNKEH